MNLLNGENHYQLLLKRNSMMRLRAESLIYENSRLEKEALRSSDAIFLMWNYIAGFKNKIRLFRTQLEDEMEMQDKRLARVCDRMRRLASWTYAGALKVKDVMEKECALGKQIASLEKSIESADANEGTGKLS